MTLGHPVERVSMKSPGEHLMQMAYQGQQECFPHTHLLPFDFEPPLGTSVNLILVLRCITTIPSLPFWGSIWHQHQNSLPSSFSWCSPGLHCTYLYAYNDPYSWYQPPIFSQYMLHLPYLALYLNTNRPLHWPTWHIPQYWPCILSFWYRRL